MHSTCSGAAAADVIPKSRMAEGIGYFGIYTTIALAAGPGIAIAIIGDGTMSDFRTLFFTVAGMCAACAAINYCISYERKRKKASAASADFPAAEAGRHAGTPSGNGKEALPKTLFGFEYAVFAPVIVMILIYGGNAGLMGFLTPFARWKGIENPGLYFTVNAIGLIMSRLALGRVVDKRGSDVVIIPAMVVLIICLVLLPLIETLTQLVLLAFPIGLSVGAILPTFNSMIFNRCSPARRGTASGAFFAAIDIGFALGAPLLGALADARDHGYVYRAGAISVTLALIVYILICSDKRYKARQARKEGIKLQ
jgi:predicted MFS family arabinose efflux permease